MAQILTPRNSKIPGRAGRMESSRESAQRSEFKGNFQKSSATLWHLLLLDGTIYKGFQRKGASIPSLELHTAITKLLNTQKPALLHRLRQQTLLSFHSPSRYTPTTTVLENNPIQLLLIHGLSPLCSPSRSILKHPLAKPADKMKPPQGCPHSICSSCSQEATERFSLTICLSSLGLPLLARCSRRHGAILALVLALGRNLHA